MVQTESKRKVHREEQCTSKLKVGRPIFLTKMSHSKKVTSDAIAKSADDTTVSQVIKIKHCEKYQRIFTKLGKWGSTNKIQNCAI